MGFRRSLEAAVAYVLTYPLGAPLRTDDVRAKPLARYPFTILYRADGQLISVLAIADQRRDPDYYSSRLS